MMKIIPIGMKFYHQYIPNGNPKNRKIYEEQTMKFAFLLRLCSKACYELLRCLLNNKLPSLTTDPMQIEILINNEIVNFQKKKKIESKILDH